MTPSRGDSMLLVLPVPFRLLEGTLHVEAQAANGLDRWADHFAHLTVVAPLLPESEAPNLAGFRWLPVSGLTHAARITCHALPWAYTPAAFAQALPATRRRLASLIPKSRHLQFALGGLVGDWATVAALQAIRLRRPFAIHTDRVEHQVMRQTAAHAPPLRRLKIALEAPLIERTHRHIIRRCTLGLWHGDDCFRAYASWAPQAQNHLVHDVHTTPADLITPADLAAKLAALAHDSPLRLIYTGRLDPMKAPLDWLRALAHARDLGARFHATWFGEGPMLPEVLAERTRLALTDYVDYPGFVASRADLLAHVRAAHALVFTHVTPESPRNLLESLVSGTPILGYNNAYAANLLTDHGGGALVSVHDHAALGHLIATLASDRPRLAYLTTAAAQSGQRFTDTAVFAERSHLIQQFA